MQLLPPGTGTDPNTGRVLKDRFHQVRAGGRGQQLAPDTLNTLAMQLVTDRGAPATPANVQMARDYLLGGGLGMFEQQQETEAGIADAAIAAESGGAQMPPPTAVSGAPMPRPSGDSVMPTAPVEQPLPPGGDDSILPLLLAPAARVVADDVPTPSRQPLALPPPPPQLTYSPTGERIPQPQLDALPPPMPIESAPITTEEVMSPQSPQPNAAAVQGKGTPVGTGSVDTPNGPVEYTIYRDGQSYSGVASSGETIEGRTASDVRRELRRALRGL